MARQQNGCHKFIAQFDAEFYPKLEKRADSFRILFDHLCRHPRLRLGLTLVETGCVRAREDWRGAGCSSLLFDAFAAAMDARFVSIDIDPRHCALVRKLCPNTEVICGDSVATLNAVCNTVSRIDLLYLDSYDVDWGNPHPSALHHLQELCAAARALLPGSLVFVDDNKPGSGKGMYVREYLKRVGATQICDAYQIGFIMGPKGKRRARSRGH